MFYRAFLSIIFVLQVSYVFSQTIVEEKLVELDEIEVLSESIIRSTYKISHLNKTKIEQMQVHDIGKLLTSQPNISGIKKGSVGIEPVMRGFKYSQLLILLNSNTKIEGGCPNRMDPTFSHISKNNIDNIIIYRGPYALKYGTNFGGLIKIITNKLQFYHKFENHIDALFGAQSNHVGLNTNLKIYGGGKKVAYSVSGSWSKFGDYKDGNGNSVNASSEHYDFTANLGFKPAEGHLIKLDFTKSYGLNVDFPALAMDEREDDTKIYDIEYFGTKFKAKSMNFIRAGAYFSDVNHIMDNKQRPFSDTVVAISEIHATNLGANIAANFNLYGGKLEAGLDYYTISKSGDRTKQLIKQYGLPQFSESIWDNAEVSNIGLFAEYQIDIRRINYVFSLRADNNYATSKPMERVKPNGDLEYYDSDTKSDYFNFSINAGLNWEWQQGKSLSFSIGRGMRSPDITERYIILLPVGYDNYDYLGNPQLKPEINYEADLGLSFSKQKYGSVSVSGFFSFVEDFISAKEVPPSVVRPQTKGVLGVKQFINVDHVYLTGFEFAYKSPHKKLWGIELNAAYTLGINNSLPNNDYLAEIPPLEANLSFNYKLFKNSLIPSLNFRMVASQNKVSTEFMEDATPGFGILDFNLVYRYSDNLSFMGSISNIFNTAYYEHLNRRIIGSKSPFYEAGRVFSGKLIFKF